ncbi:MAG: tRNA uridine-5-carboxymethylaminomethyl(34) synthesis GTPase MnmE [Bacteroidales bacterium]|nr:tRNA uridine-5-carboxymethylaminomethyl(34) synthesis GTPase MnmE [Bacteroidales bacterium]
MINNSDTICAIATAEGSAAIAVIRLSGDDAINIASKVFVSANKNKILTNLKANTIHFGTISFENEIVDEVLVSIFKSPHSYTGENSVEISCHGSNYIQHRVLEILIKNGARIAKPGEFTMRAFLNGKMDLSQAEGVADIIASTSEASRKIAFNQIRGGFSEDIKYLRSRLLNFISLIELELDFSEEDVEFADRKQLKTLVDEIKNFLEKLISSFKYGNVIKNGIPVAIIGEPNVGKSTLLNALLNEDKAIVSEIAGTTRDSIEDVVNLKGTLFRFIDTAGLRDTEDIIENLGIKKTYEKISKAEIVLMLVDVNEKNISEKVNLLSAKLTSKNLVVVVNKIDQIKDKKEFEKTEHLKLISISAKNKTNIEKLINLLIEVSGVEKINKNETVITNLRHYEALTKSYEAIERVEISLQNQISSDFLSIDIKEVLHYLGEISGQITNDEILGNIFKNFCIGK